MPEYLRKSPSGKLVSANVYSPLGVSDLYVDSVLGDDSMSGASALRPIQSLAELSRILQFAMLTTPLTVHLAGDFSTEDIQAEVLALDGAYLQIVGTAVESESGTLTAYTAEDAATNQAVEIEDTSQDFSALVGARIRLTSGSGVGGCSWVAKANPSAGGVDTARVAPFPTAPSASDAYAIESLPAVRGISLTVKSASADDVILLNDLQVVDSLYLIGPASVARCEIDADAVQTTDATFSECEFAPTSGVELSSESVTLQNCTLLSSGALELWGASDGELSACLFQGAGIVAYASVCDLTSPLGFFDLADAITLETNSKFYEGASSRIYGGSVSGTTLVLGIACILSTQPDVDPAIIGATGAVRIGGTDEASFVRSFNTTYASGIVPGWTPAALGADVQWWTYDDDSGRSMYTASNPDQYASLPNHGSIGGNIAQGVPADQTLLSSVGGRTAGYADGACVMVASAAASDFKFLHDGTGATVQWVMDLIDNSTRVCFATCTAAGNGIYAYTSGGSQINVAVRNAGASCFLATFNGVSLGTHIVTLKWSAAAGYSLQVDDGTPVTGAVGAASSSDPTTTMIHHSQSPTKTFAYVGHMPEIFAVNRILTNDEIAQGKAYLTQRWLQPWSEVVGTDVPWPRLLLDASDTSSVTVTGSGVSDWSSTSGLAIVGKQTVDGSRPPYTSGQYVDFDGTADHLLLTGWVAPAGKRTVVAVVDHATAGYMWSGGMVFTLEQTGNVAHYDVAFKSSGATATGPQVLAWQLDNATTSTHRRNGSSLGTVTYTDTALTGAISLGSHLSGGSNWWGGKVYELLIFQPALTLAQLQAVESYLNSKWTVY